MIKVTGLYIYPVKSLGGISLSQAQFGARGLMYDREWLIVDKNNRFVSQREIAKMSLIQTEIDEEKGCLILRLPLHTEAGTGAKTTAAAKAKSKDQNVDQNFEVLSVPLEQNKKAETIRVTVWSDNAKATVEEDNINAALSNFLQAELRLTRMAPGHRRRVDGRYAPGKDNIVGFADAFPLLIIGEESLDDLNERLDYPILINRFRPNITTRGGGAFGEDNWTKIKIGAVEITIVKPCDRCVITTIDQESGVQGKEPLRTLANYRKKNGKILFGQNAIFHCPGKLAIGDAVSLLASGSAEAE